MRPTNLLPAVFAALAALAALAACGGTKPPPSFEPWTLQDLTASEGFSIRCPEEDIPKSTEVQDCIFVDTPDLNGGQDYWVSRVEIAANPGTHHTSIFRVRTIERLDPAKGEAMKLGSYPATIVRGGAPGTGECWKSGNWSDWPLVANTQQSDPRNPYTDFQLPAGVGMRMHPGEKLMIQTHYVNATTQQTPDKGRVGFNFYRMADPSPMELGTLFATQQSIRICRSSPTPSFSSACGFKNAPVHIVGVNGHFHSRGTRFDVFTWDGKSTTAPAPSQRFYDSTAWDEPPMEFGLDLRSPPGGGIYWTCDYQWREPSPAAGGCAAVDARDPEKASDCCYTFGPIVETSEHCNVFLYYWPKVASASDIFCN